MKNGLAVVKNDRSGHGEELTASGELMGWYFLKLRFLPPAIYGPEYRKNAPLVNRRAFQPRKHTLPMQTQPQPPFLPLMTTDL